MVRQGYPPTRRKKKEESKGRAERTSHQPQPPPKPTPKNKPKLVKNDKKDKNKDAPVVEKIDFLTVPAKKENRLLTTELSPFMREMRVLDEEIPWEELDPLTSEKTPCKL